MLGGSPPGLRNELVAAADVFCAPQREEDFSRGPRAYAS